jgi:hypothetical protein
LEGNLKVIGTPKIWRLSEDFERYVSVGKRLDLAPRFEQILAALEAQVISFYFPCRTSIPRIASESLTFPR